MSRNLYWISRGFVCVLTIVAVATGAAWGGQTLDDVLARVDFNGNEKADALGKALAELEPADLAKLCDMLVEPGEGDDNKPRMALQGLTWYVASGSTPAQRAKYVKVLCAALDGERPDSIKSFLIQQLQLIGDSAAVPTLARFLPRGELYDYAAQALLSIRGDEAAAAFRAALPDAAGDRRITMIDALGVLRDRLAIPLLMPDFKSDDPEIKTAARMAAANIGVHPGLEPPSATQPWFSQAERWAIVFRLASRLAENKEVRTAAEMLRAALGAAGSPTPVHVRCAALADWARITGAAAIADVAEVMAEDDAELRACAAETAVALPGTDVTMALAAQLPKAAPAARGVVLNVLERRGDAAALPAVLVALRDADKGARLAAVSAAATLGQDMAVTALVEFLATDQSDERDAAKLALERITAPTASALIGKAIEAAAPPVQVALLDVLTSRRAHDQLRMLFGCATSKDESVRIAAIRGIGVLGDPKVAGNLLPLLKKAQSEAERQALEEALAATCNRADTPAARSFQILAALRPADEANFASLLRVLGHIGGADALNSVRVGLKDQRESVREAAFKALLDWPDPTGADDVLKIARDTQELKDQVLALRAYARLVALDNDRPAPDALKMYEAGLEAARRPDEQKLFLSKLGEVRDPGVLPVLERYATDETLRAEAEAALVTAADGLLPSGWEAARAAVDKVLACTKVESVRTRAAEVRSRIGELEDFITDWRVAGPYQEAGKGPMELFDVVFAPEETKPQAPVTWQKQPVTDDRGRYWFVNLHALESIAGDNRAAYLLTHVFSPKAQSVQLELGSDDSLKAWLNGELVHKINAPRGCQRGEDKVAVNLKEGWNSVLLKVVNGGGDWGACARFRTPDGGHLDGLRVDAAHTD